LQLYQFLSTPLALARHYLSLVLEPGDWAVDATLGKGRDLLFLCEMVGEKGLAFGFDIQEQALAYTERLLETKGWKQRAKLILDNHANLIRYLPKERVKAIMFNLGYLPGGDHSIITQPESTLEAVRQGLEALCPGGIMTLVVYYGHPGGLEEKAAIEGLAAELDPHFYSVVKIDFFNRKNDPPLLIVIEKKIE